MVKVIVAVGEHWSLWLMLLCRVVCVVSGGAEVESALEGVDEMLLNMAIDAPIGKVVADTRRFVRLSGVDALRVRRRVSVCGWLGIGSLVGSLVAWRLLHSKSKEVVLVFLRSSL